MQCPKCQTLLVPIRSTSDGPDDNLHPEYSFRDETGYHSHDPRTWTGTARCRNGHVVKLRQKLPCPIPSCSFNDDATKPKVIDDADDAAGAGAAVAPPG